MSRLVIKEQVVNPVEADTEPQNVISYYIYENSFLKALIKTFGMNFDIISGFNSPNIEAFRLEQGYNKDRIYDLLTTNDYVAGTIRIIEPPVAEKDRDIRRKYINGEISELPNHTKDSSVESVEEPTDDSI